MKKITKNYSKEVDMEKDILKKVYGYEAKRTYKTIFILWIAFFIAQFLIVLIGGSIYNTLKEQQTLDLLQLFGEDVEIIKENILDILYTFYLESPQLLLSIFMLLSLTVFGIIFFATKNFKKIKNRLKSINTFFSKK